jgi:hypothetical protein
MNHWPELQPDAAAQIQTALSNGRKIEAIRIYRNATGSGLKEAKDAIERAGLIQPRDVRRSPGTNWFVLFLFLLIPAIVLIFLLLRLR